MHSAARIVLFACAATGLLVHLSGCASRGPSQGPSSDAIASGHTFSVSAREYGYVRPAIDVRVIGREDGKPKSRRRYASTGGDLWDRVRYGESLGVTHHERIEQAARALKLDRDYLTDLSKRAQPYLHLIIEELERSGLPAELALLPEVESRYNPRAVSPKSATGMWQFMPYTGVEMGLKQNHWYDGRNDILASTRGAIAYLRQLHRQLDGDWALALAAYNAGPGRVRAAQRANKAAGKPLDFWSLDLPSETEAYVPKMLAIAKLVREHDTLGLKMPTIANHPRIEVVESRQQIDLAQAAQACGVTVTQLKRLNPGLKRGKTLPSGPHQVLVPAGTGDRLRTALAQAGALKAPSLAATAERSAAGKGQAL